MEHRKQGSKRNNSTVAVTARKKVAVVCLTVAKEIMIVVVV
jgi:hypothetical protein